MTQTCADCGAGNPDLMAVGDPYRFVCKNQSACEARRMLADGAPSAVAAAHAQALRPAVQLGFDNGWRLVLYALDCFAVGACGHDDTLPNGTAMDLAFQVRQQLRTQVIPR